MSDSIKAFESRAKRAGFHNFEIKGIGGYADVFLQHFYFGWESAFDYQTSCSEITNNSEPVDEMTDNICKCSMAVSLTGDGCRYCNPQEYIDRLEEWLVEEREELAEVKEWLQEEAAEIRRES